MVELTLSFDHKESEFELHESAAKQIINLIDVENKTDQALMLSVKPGGCAGFVYEFGWVPVHTLGKKFEKLGATLIIREADLRLIDGGELKFIESLAGSKFEVSNPNASNACGCGKSFS